MPRSAMIFAAGRGTRMGALTLTRPKPLIEVGGKLLLDHALELVEQSPIEQIVINVHHLGSQIAKHVEARDIIISDESDKLLETGGGLKQALTLLKRDEVVTLNSDAVWTGPNPVNALLEAWNPEKMDALLMLVGQNDAVGHKGKGDFLLNEDGTIQRGRGLTFTGCQIIKTSFVRDISDDVFSLNVVWDRILDNQRAYGLLHTGKWCDVGHPEGIQLAEDMLGSANV